MASIEPPMELDEAALTPQSRANRLDWNANSEQYQAAHGARLFEVGAAWGVWSIPEEELQVLGEVAGRDVLELGCGGAQFGIALAKRGARVTGIDLAERQLEFAQVNVTRAGVPVTLVHASAEALPFADGAFDIVFSDHGATTFGDPELIVPEVARVLRPGGTFAFNGASVMRHLCEDQRGRLLPKFVRDYFELGRREVQGGVEYVLGYGEWIRVLGAHGLVVEAIFEPQPARDATSTYTDFADLAWGRRWPLETLWKARKRGALPDQTPAPKRPRAARRRPAPASAADGAGAPPSQPDEVR